MLYTRKGDTGTTKTFGCDQRVSKSSAIAEALGSLDEINSFLGVAKCLENSSKIIPDLAKILLSVQEKLFIIQAQVAGSDKVLQPGKVTELEQIIDSIEQELPPIKTFFISGGTSLAATLDYARTLARRAERRVVAVSEEGQAKIAPTTLAYLNRLSSLLYALARLANHKSGIKEQPPSYK